ncbi:hypothetical protein [Actinopolymorpha pittospori]
MASGFVEDDKKDEEFSEALRFEMASVRPNVEELVGGGVARGRRGIRRRRMAQFAAAGATFAVLGGVAYAAPWNALPATELGVASGATGSGVPAAAKTVPITPQATVRLLIDQLPADARTGKYFGGWNGQFTSSGGEAKSSGSDAKSPGGDGRSSVRGFERTGTYAEFAYFDQHGASLMGLEVQWKYADASYLDCPAPARGATCDRRTLSDGSTLMVDQDREYPAGARYGEGKGPKVWSAALLRKDGLMVRLWENNGPEEKGPETRANPPLTTAQLEAIVTSPVWQAKVDADVVRRAAPLFTPTTPEGKVEDARLGPGDRTDAGAVKGLDDKATSEYKLRVGDKLRVVKQSGSADSKAERVKEKILKEGLSEGFPSSGGGR